MQVRVFTLPFSQGQDGFPDEVVRQFTVDKDVLYLREHFFTQGGVPHLVLVLGWAPLAPVPTKLAPPREEPRDPKVDLKEADWPVFKALKQWRADKAREDRVPPYLYSARSPRRPLTGTPRSS